VLSKLFFWLIRSLPPILTFLLDLPIPTASLCLPFPVDSKEPHKLELELPTPISMYFWLFPSVEITLLASKLGSHVGFHFKSDAIEHEENFF
jgi:hypothetical protein